MSRFRRWTREERPARPDQGTFISGTRDDLERDSSLTGVNPKKLANALRLAQEGDILAQAELFDRIQQDPQVMAIYAKRCKAVLGKPLVFTAADDSPQAEQAQELVEEVIGEIPHWREALRHLQDAIGRGFSASQIVWDWDTVAKRYVVRKLQWWKQREFTLDEDDPDEVRVFTDENMSAGDLLAPWQWIVHRYKATSGHIGEASILRGLAWPWLFKHASWRDWVIFGEAFGMPRRVGWYPRGASEDERKAVWAAVKLLGRDGAVALPDGARMEFIKAEGGKGTLPYPELIQLCDRYIAKVLVGQTLTTEESERGTQALGTVHKEVQDDLVEDDAIALAETLRDQLVRPIVGFNLGWDAPVPEVKFLIEDDEDLLERVQRDAIIATQLKVPGSIRYIREKYDWPEPEDDEDALIVSSPAPQPGANETAVETAARLLELAAQKKSSEAWVASRMSSRGRSRGPSTTRSGSVRPSSST